MPAKMSDRLAVARGDRRPDRMMRLSGRLLGSSSRVALLALAVVAPSEVWADGGRGGASGTSPISAPGGAGGVDGTAAEAAGKDGLTFASGSTGGGGGGGAVDLSTGFGAHGGARGAGGSGTGLGQVHGAAGATGAAGAIVNTAQTFSTAITGAIGGAGQTAVSNVNTTGGGGGGGIGASATADVSVTATGRLTGGAGRAQTNAGSGGGGVGLFSSANVTVMAGGQITGGAGGGHATNTFAGGGGGMGVLLISGGTLNNSGIIRGGAGGAGGLTGDGGGGGAGVLLTAGGTVINAAGASIVGGVGGNARYNSTWEPRAGLGGAGVKGAGITLVNAGTITGAMGGTASGVGAPAAVRAAAVQFTGGVNSLEIHAGSTITGNVLAYSVADALRLGGATDASFDVSAIGAAAQYRGFGVYEKSGISTWTLTGATSAATPWTLSQGVLSVSSDEALGASSGGLTFNGGTLRLDADLNSARMIAITAAGGTVDTQGNSGLLGGSITGAGALAKIGTGTLTLTGENSYTGGTTIAAGTLQLGNGGSSGSITGNVLNNGALIFNRSDRLNFAGTISGTGTIQQIGSGATHLAGDSSIFSGSTSVYAGVLSINGVLGGTLAVLGGRLQGSGTVGATTIAAGGTIAPGNSIGTLTVNGTFAQAAGSTYQVEVDPGTATSDLIRVNGTATIASGAALSVVNYTGAPYAAGQRYTILTSTGLTGSYGFGEQVLSPFLSLRDSYDAENAYLTVIQTRSVGGVGGTPNEVAVGNSVDRLPAGNAVQTGVLNQISIAAARQALGQLSGEIHASARTALIDESWILRAAVNDRLRAAFGLVDAPSMVTMSYGYTADLSPAMKGPMPTLQQDRLAVWGQGFGDWGRTGSDGNAAKLSRSTGGFLLGADVATFDNLRFGVLAGYSRSDFDVTSRASAGESDNYHLGIYGGGRWGALSLRSGASYTWHDLSTSRLVTAAYLGGNPRADYDAATMQVFGEVGYRMNVVGVELQPFAGLAYVNLHSGRFAEQGAATALAASSQDTGLGYSTLGLRASKTFDIRGMDLTLRGGLAWRHAFGDVNPSVTMAFADSTPFTISGLPIARDAAMVEAGLDLAAGRGTTFGIAYAGQLAEDTQDHSFKGVLAVKF